MSFFPVCIQQRRDRDDLRTFHHLIFCNMRPLSRFGTKRTRAMRVYRIMVAAFAFLTVIAARPAAAQSYPDKPIKIVVAVAAGGPMDTMTPAVGASLNSAAWRRDGSHRTRPRAEAATAAAIPLVDRTPWASPQSDTTFRTEQALAVPHQLDHEIPLALGRIGGACKPACRQRSQGNVSVSTPIRGMRELNGRLHVGQRMMVPR